LFSNISEEANHWKILSLKTSEKFIKLKEEYSTELTDLSLKNDNLFDENTLLKEKVKEQDELIFKITQEITHAVTYKRNRRRKHLFEKL
jgi:uncharacterized membrane protein